MLWCFGFVSSLFMGCSPPQALLRATAYALSGLAGWIAYLLIRRPSDSSFSSLFPASYAGVGNIPLLGPTRIPWPFPEMFAHGLIVSVLCMSLIALVFRLLRMGGKSAPLSVARRTFDAEAASPVDPDRL